MTKAVCIYPQDESTDFLLPLFEKMCSCGWGGWHKDSNSCAFEIPELLANASHVAFLGHGSSGQLYGSPLNGQLSTLIDDKNINLLQYRTCFILACNSNQFCENYGLIPSIGFGDLPTGEHDVKVQLDMDTSFPLWTQETISVYDEALVRSISRAFEKETAFDIEFTFRRILLFVNVEITECLCKKSCEQYRSVADMLQRLKNECALY